MLKSGRFLPVESRILGFRIRNQLKESRIQGRFPFSPKFRKFRLEIKLERTVSVRSDRNIWEHLWRWSTLTDPVISVDPTEKLTELLSLVPLFLYPAYKKNNQTRGGLGRVCATGMYRSIGHVKFPKFQTGIFAE